MRTCCWSHRRCWSGLDWKAARGVCCTHLAAGFCIWGQADLVPFEHCLCLQRGYKVKALSRSSEKARSLFGAAQNLEVEFANMCVCVCEAHAPTTSPVEQRLVCLQLVQGDCREAGDLQKIFDGVDAVVCVLGTTAFPSARYSSSKACLSCQLTQHGGPTK